MNIASSPRIVLLGMMSKMPVAGVVWQTVHYLVGLRRLGCDVFYVEAHGCTPRCFMMTADDDGYAKAAEFIDCVMRRFDFADRWSYHPLYGDNRHFGMSESKLRELYASADLIINLHGGTEPLSEHSAHGRLVYLETDPVELQIELIEQRPQTLQFLEPHSAFFSFGENLGAPDCKLPVSDRFQFKPTRQPVVLDFWEPYGNGAAELFTSVGNWRQVHRQVKFEGEIYHWNKEYEFQKFIDLPSRTTQAFELALSSYEPADKALLESKGWRVRHGLDISTDIDAYRAYIGGSRGEFTVAKDQNVRLRSGWFSDRSATYLAAGRPVITQETGFSNSFPTGEGLFAFSTTEDALSAIESITSDYERHRRASREIARDYFNYDIVLGRFLDELGIRSTPAKPLQFPSQMVIEPISRLPLRLPEATTRAVLLSPVPSFGSHVENSALDGSVIVVTHNQLAFTRMCLESALANSGGAELIVIDNASTDGTPDYLRVLSERNPGLRVVCNPVNRGFAAATNQGLAIARGSILVLLNNDTIVPPGWLARLSRYLEDAGVGLIGPVTNRIGNEAEIEAGYMTFGEMTAFAARQQGGLFDIARPAMFCLAMRRDTFEKIGPLDEQFEIGLFEDDDYAMRVRAAGLRLVCASDVFVHHFSQASFGGLVPSGDYQILFEANRKRFEDKWNTRWEPAPVRASQDYIDAAELLRDSVKPMLPHGARVLVVSKGDDELLKLNGCLASHFPQDDSGDYAGFYPADSGEAIAQIEALRAKGAEFLIFPPTARWWLDHYAEMRRHLETIAVPKEYSSFMIFDLRQPGGTLLE